MSRTRAQQLLRQATMPEAKWAEKWGGGCYAHFRKGQLGHHLTVSPELSPTSVPSGILIHSPFRHSRCGPWFIRMQSLCVCLCVCVSVTRRIPTVLHGPGCKLRNGKGCSLVVHYWVDLQSVHRFHCYDNIARTRSVSDRCMPGLT